MTTNKRPTTVAEAPAVEADILDAAAAQVAAAISGLPSIHPRRPRSWWPQGQVDPAADAQYVRAQTRALRACLGEIDELVRELREAAAPSERAES